MPTNDDLATDQPLPLFLSRHADEPDIGEAWDIAVISSPLLRAGLLVVTASAIGLPPEMKFSGMYSATETTPITIVDTVGVRYRGSILANGWGSAP